MTRKEALTELLGAIEAGTFNARKLPKMTMADLDKIHAAYNGSLDAAKALHESVLPGWECGYDGAIAWVKLPGLRTSYRHSGTGYTARSWLIAIIKALIAECDE